MSWKSQVCTFVGNNHRSERTASSLPLSCLPAPPLFALSYTPYPPPRPPRPPPPPPGRSLPSSGHQALLLPILPASVFPLAVTDRGNVVSLPRQTMCVQGRELQQGRFVEEAPVEGPAKGPGTGHPQICLNASRSAVGSDSHCQQPCTHAATQVLPPLYTSRSRWTVRPRSSLLKHRALKSRSHLHRGIANNSSAHLSTPPLMQMDTKQSPNSSLRSGNNQPESEVDINEQYEQYSDGDSAEDNGERPRKRQRRPMSVSCELCKQRKVKCDRGQPSCGWCTRNGAICEYKERKKPGLRAGYGRELEQRLDRLEDILRSHAQILESSFTNHSGSIPSDQETPRSVTGFRSNEQRSHVPHAETALFLQKPSDFPTVSQSIDFTNGMPPTPTLHGDVFQQQAMQQANHNHMQSGQAPEFYNTNQPPLASPSLNITQTQTELASDNALPPYDLLYALVDLYFKYVNTWCPILHRRTTLDSLFGSQSLDEADRILLHAIVATTLRFSTDQRLTEERRRHYHDVSKQKVLLFGLENSNVKALQALVILALDLVGSSNGPPGWNLLALITRSVVQLGLAVETTSFSVSPNYPSIYTLRAMVLPEANNWIEEESRRRLFWMVYLLDRYATIATAFEFALDEREIDRTLPCRDDLWNKNQSVQTRWFRTSDRPESDIDKPENLGAFSYYIEILGILSKIHKFLKKPVDISALSDVEQWQGEYRELDNMLTSWKFNLPGDYGNMAKLFQPGGNKSINCGWVMLHATYHTAVIRLHSSAAYPTTRSPIFTPSYSASQRCHGAVENIAALGEYVLQNGMLPKLGPPFAFTLWVAARLLLVHGSTIEHKLSPQIQFFVDTLQEMGRYWLVAERYTAILQRVLDEHGDSERSAGANGERVTPSSVKILADMRRCAYDLDFLISRQPKHIGMVSRLPSVTPARTPAPNELEYLDVFDFFNVPRLPMAQGEMGQTPSNGVGELPMSELQNGSNEFNITNYMVDANSDWLFKNQS